MSGAIGPTSTKRWRFGGGRSLRRRIAVSVGLFTTLVVILFGVSAWLLVGRSLQSAADADLRNTVDSIVAIRSSGAFAQDDLFDRVDDFDGPDDEALRPPIPFVQVLDGNGTAQIGELPVSDQAAAVAAGDVDESLESITVGDRTYRMLTVGLDADPEAGFDRGALQVGSDITNTIDGLRQARAATSLAGLLAGLGAAALAWLLSRHLIAPVTAVADAADFVRTNDELPDRLEGEGPDELGRLVTSFNAMLDDVRRSREQQRRLIADASHELRTPLTSLRIKVEFVQSQPDLAAQERQRLLDGAVAELESLGLLVTELVELASEGATPERPRLVELADVVTAETHRFRTTSGRTVEVETTPGLVETRPKQTTRALTNLLVNADKYSPEGAPITVRQRGPRIEVIDRGAGIPAGDRARVFDRFYRGRSHQSIEGSGLGLAIVKSVAKANGGTVWVDDPGDKGPGTVVGFSVGPSLDDGSPD